MIIEYKTYCHDDNVQEISSGDVLRYCDLKNISLDGGEFDNTFLSCEIEFCDLYWVLFNNCLFVDVRFFDCKFSGVSFISCRFINCDFVNCKFTRDNFNQLCSFTETIWFGCKVEHSNGYLTVFDLYSILVKKGSLKDKLKKWLKVIFDLLWGIG